MLLTLKTRVRVQWACVHECDALAYRIDNTCNDYYIISIISLIKDHFYNNEKNIINITYMIMGMCA